MPFELDKFETAPAADYLTYLVDRQWSDNQARHDRLWNYFRNPLVPAIGAVGRAMNVNSRPYVQAQEVGLPARITGVAYSAAGIQSLTDVQRKEVVIENDIAWRIQTGIDFIFGKDIVIRSLAGDPQLAETIEQVISAMLAANGGIGFLQEMALYGAVFGFVDIALRTPADGTTALPVSAQATSPSAGS